MGKNFCVCNDILNNHETESNIFSGMPKNRHIEKEAIKTLNSVNQVNQTSENKTIQDDNSSNSYRLNVFENEIYKNNFNKLQNSNKYLNKSDNFQCSGKFNVLQTNQNQQLSNGGNEKNEICSLNDNKNIYNNGSVNIVKKNELGFVSFKSFYEINNNTGEKENKDNNTNNSVDINNKNKEENLEKNNDKTKIEQNSFSICKKNNENGNLKNENSDYRYNDISQYSDISDKDYLNNESNYYNSNKREENRENYSLSDEENQNQEN